jgi:diketogulonate reductase-like aldo/keto reductase
MHPKYLKSGVYDSCIESLKKLGLDYLDLFLIHWPGAAKIPSSSPDNAVYRKNTWKEMERLVREGKCKHIGVSNYEIKHLRELLDYAVIPPYLNQFELHPYLYNKELVEFCKQHNIRVQAYSSLGQGDSRLLSHPTVTKIASKLQKTPAQILLRWATQKNILVIPKSITNGRIIENMDCINWEIPEFEMQQLDQFDASIRFCWDPTIVA